MMTVSSPDEAGPHAELLREGRPGNQRGHPHPALEDGALLAAERSVARHQSCSTHGVRTVCSVTAKLIEIENPLLAMRLKVA